MNREYLAELTDDEIKELFIEVAEECLGSTIFEDNCFVQRNYDTVAVKGLINTVKIGDKKLPYPINIKKKDLKVKKKGYILYRFFNLEYAPEEYLIRNGYEIIETGC